MLSVFTVLSFRLILIGCVAVESKSNILYLYPKDSSQVVTVFSNYSDNTRTIAVGRHSVSPKSNYVKLDISKIRDDGDAIGICWNKNGHSWEMVNNDAKIVEIKLDTTKYVVRENWFRDKREIPNSAYYEGTDCFVVETFDYSKPKPPENGIVERGIRN